MLNSLNLESIKPTEINLTGVRLLVIFSLLLKSPITAEEINEYFEKNNYPKETFSADTLRNDLNALRQAGCEITRADKTNQFKYKILSHPFEITVDNATVKAIFKLYKQIYTSLKISDLIYFEEFFNFLSAYNTNEENSEKLRGLSKLKDIDKDLLKSLLQAENTGHTISFDYNSPTSGKIKYTFKHCYMNFRSEKLYLNGYNLTYNKYSFLPVSNIISPIIIHTEKDLANDNEIKVICELKNEAMLYFKEKPDEKIIEKYTDKIVVQITSFDFFKLNQRILEYGPNCTVISPESVRNYTINTLKQMYEVYSHEQI